MIRRQIHPLALLGAVALATVACTALPGTSTPATPAPVESPAAGGGASGTCPTSQPAALPAGETRTVRLDTPKGTIAIKVEADLSPIAAGNFVALADCGFYDGVVFHRAAALENGTPFVIQGGDPTGTGGGGPGYTIQDEPVTAKYSRGTVAMARTSEPNSVGSQFFIVLDDAARDALAAYNTYQIIGRVTDGMDAVDAIYAAAGGQESPADPIPMTTVTVATP
jgi:cyclophilin family peptidyl-prolyl cis-trans isomerase